MHQYGHMPTVGHFLDMKEYKDLAAAARYDVPSDREDSEDE